MRLHLTETEPFAWAANWADSQGETLGNVTAIDPDGCQDWPHRALYAVAAASADHSDDCDGLPEEIELCLTEAQWAATGNFRARLERGPWEGEAAALAAALIRRGIRVRCTTSSQRERAWMRDLGCQVAVAEWSIGRGGVATLLAGVR